MRRSKDHGKRLLSSYSSSVRSFEVEKKKPCRGPCHRARYATCRRWRSGFLCRLLDSLAATSNTGAISWDKGGFLSTFTSRLLLATASGFRPSTCPNRPGRLSLSFSPIGAVPILFRTSSFFYLSGRVQISENRSVLISILFSFHSTEPLLLASHAGKRCFRSEDTGKRCFRSAFPLFTSFSFFFLQTRISGHAILYA